MSIEEPPAEPDATPEVVTEPPVEMETPKPQRRRIPVAVIVLAALSLVLGVTAANLSSRNQTLTSRTKDVNEVAAAMGSALLTYDYRELPKTKELVLKLATGTFEKQYNAAFEGGLDTVLTNSKAVSQVRDIDVFVGEVNKEHASAIVVVQTVVSGTAGANRSLTSYVQLELVKTDDGWLVDGVTNLNLGLPTGGTTPTTAAGSSNVTTTTR